jgi:D-hydroxyproline dehydrogenase subunit beta
VVDRQVDHRLRGGRRGLTGSPDIAIVGGGIVGCAAAAFLAEAGLSVELFERGELAGAASGRNQGSVQHPFDELLVPLHEETVSIYRALEGFPFPDEPAGLLLLSRSGAVAVGDPPPELRPEWLDGRPLTELEPSLAPGISACRLETGYPVRPEAATRALAALARARGAVLQEGVQARLDLRGRRTHGVLLPDGPRAAGVVLVAAGPWTSSFVDSTGGWRPIEPVWGVVAEVELEDPPRHVLEQAGVEEAAAGELASLFSLVATPHSSGVGSSFSATEPDPLEVAHRLLKAGQAFVPALCDAQLSGARACPRPQSADGRPLIGPVPGIDGLHVAAGHGPWGISTGPASARLAAEVVLGRASVPAELAADRFGPPRHG